MCAGALVLARIDKLVYGCDDPKTGAVKSLYNIVSDKRLNHRVDVTSGVLADDCSALLQDILNMHRKQAYLAVLLFQHIVVYLQVGLQPAQYKEVIWI